MDDAPLSVVSAYLSARDAFDYDRARRFLADQGFEFISPIAQFQSADAFIEHASLTGAIIQSVTQRKVFVDGDDVCHFLTYHIQLSDKFSATVVHWARVVAGRIVRIELVYDASAYRELFPADAE